MFVEDPIAYELSSGLQQRRSWWSTTSNETEKLQLTGGMACLLWRGRAEAEADNIATSMVYVPLHCGNPLRPVFMNVAFAAPEDEDLARSHALCQSGESFLHFKVLQGDCGFTFLSPLQLVSSFNLTLLWEVVFLVLSDRAVLQGCRQTFTARVTSERPLPVWDGAEAEWNRRRRQRARQGPAAAPHDDADDDADDVPHDRGSGNEQDEFFNPLPQENEEQEDEVADNSDGDEAMRGDLGAQVQALIEEAERWEMAENNAAVDTHVRNSNSSQPNSGSLPESSSSSSSSSSSDDDVLVSFEEEHVSAATSAAAGGAEQGALAPQQVPARERALRPESFSWGEYFHFSFRPAVDSGGKMMMAYHVVCRFHKKIGSAACSKQVSFEPEEHDDAVKRLKLWALSAPSHGTKLEHQGRRGLPVLSEEDAARTQEWLDRQVALMPAPPR